MSGALIGFAGAIGAFGGVLINGVLRQSYADTKSATAAYWVFLAFYVLCAALTWLMFLRRPSRAGAADVPASARAVTVTA
jgi:MFS transporter, NNP family, nitrate/nitrite transporter